MYIIDGLRNAIIFLAIIVASHISIINTSVDESMANDKTCKRRGVDTAAAEKSWPSPPPQVNAWYEPKRVRFMDNREDEEREALHRLVFANKTLDDEKPKVVVGRGNSERMHMGNSQLSMYNIKSPDPISDEISGLDGWGSGYMML